MKIAAYKNSNGGIISLYVQMNKQESEELVHAANGSRRFQATMHTNGVIEIWPCADDHQSGSKLQKIDRLVFPHLKLKETFSTLLAEYDLQQDGHLLISNVPRYAIHGKRRVIEKDGKTVAVPVRKHRDPRERLREAIDKVNNLVELTPGARIDIKDGELIGYITKEVKL